ncbi:ATP-binding protein [Streptomyces sp. NPDC093071]|uniref:ATP-binding protein n=1 Tax=Streptomyces sp. NPDC093071 TaxID=3366022 RepID=UPI0037F6A05E
MQSQIGGGDRSGPGICLMCGGYALDATGGCISDARHHATAFLDRAGAEHHLPVSQRVGDLTELVVSGLVTNVVKCAPGPVLRELRVATGMVDVVVCDSDPAVPTVRPADPGRAGQHGMEIVQAVTEELLIEQEPVGTRITARIAPTDTHSPT